MLENIERGKPGHKMVSSHCTPLLRSPFSLPEQVTLYRRDGSSYIASLHGFPIFVKFPGDHRTESDPIRLSSTLLEEYINQQQRLPPLQQQQPWQQQLQTQDEEQKGEEPQRVSTATDNSFAETPNPLVELSTSNNGCGIMTGDPKRLSNLSTSLAFPSSEIPNKVAYIAVQITAIQDLRS
jgi:hypothetical protein